MSGVETTLAFLVVLGVFGAGAEMLVRATQELLAPGPLEGTAAEPAKQWGLGVVGNAIWLALGLIVFQEGVWLAYLFLH